MNDEPILSVRDLEISYRTGKRTEVTAASDINFDLYPGESMALVGESGCGKTTLGLGLLKLLPRLGRVPRGTVTYRRKDGSRSDIMKLGKEELRRFRWSEAAMVFQGAMNAFNPVQRIADHFEDTLRDHANGQKRWSTADIKRRSEELLDLVRLEPDRVLRSYPHELSGGMKQRTLIALALALEPQLLVLDEPTTALDLLTQRSIVEQLHELRERLGFSMIFITHDLGLAAELADRVSTMYAGRIIESGTAEDIFYNPRHPYTAGLIKAVLPVAGDLPELESIPGTPPNLANLPPGCAFAPRCGYATSECSDEIPALTRIEGSNGNPPHTAACLHSDQVEFSRQVVSRV
ncbi:ABC transporter ATP-binding protein [Stackebrandtia nassauensis]|uniref:Oligopeptide/dipeptide ABC transporter, ATPase subunit n=1 Tax=Stackebrandtia nassauensis (strain DSM 44728 / CIP 108903 / NRRL B-16338 / NBRC 102104 / LLR-40K-21) TaxID=446470 RepID=D3Q6T5_STANL|nr:ABC transporter ATP-binding protein [Stackebrandtia nassauensis]ADD40334.1 oligopeptide/dipeptide ABC transporter, ATPase subunit [Stackebrandtia nassauensis DSM 44728]